MARTQKQIQSLQIILVGLVTLLVLVVGALAFNFISGEDEQALANEEARQEFLSQTEAYINDKAGYSIRYYKDWHVIDRDENVDFYTEYLDIEDSYIEEVEVQFVEGVEAAEYADSLSLENRETQTINGATVEKAVYTYPFGDITLQVDAYVFSKDADIAVVAYTGEIGGDYDHFLAQAESMINSFEF